MTWSWGRLAMFLGIALVLSSGCGREDLSRSNEAPEASPAALPRKSETRDIDGWRLRSGQHPRRLALENLEISADTLQDTAASSLEPSDEFPISVREWAGTDLSSAREWVESLQAGDPRRAAGLEQVAIAFCESDVRGGLDWLSGLAGDPEARGAMISACYELARDELSSAFELAARIPEGPGRDDLFVHLVRQGGGEDLAVLESRSSNGNEALRERLLAAIVEAVSAEDAYRAALVVSGEMGSGTEQERAAVAVVQQWAQTAPRDAALWVEQFPDAPVRKICLDNLLSVWLRADSEQAVDWLAGLEAGAFREAARRSYSSAAGAH